MNFYNLRSLQNSPNPKNTQTITVYLVLGMLGTILMLCAIAMQPLLSVLEGWKQILLAPNVLFSDAMAIGGVAAALWNAGFMTLLSIGLLVYFKTEGTGAAFASVMTVCGFSLFGKNPLNAFPAISGSLMYILRNETKGTNSFVPALYASGLGPITSAIFFGSELPLYYSIPLGFIIGFLSGYLLIPIAKKAKWFHQGYSLYQIGFAAGLTATLLINPLRIWGLKIPVVMTFYSETNQWLTIGCATIFLLFIAIGLLTNGCSLKGYQRILKDKNQKGYDYIIKYGFGLSLFNSGLTSLCILLILVALNVRLNGPILGALITIAGFSTYGKHIVNISPIMIGALLATFAIYGKVNSTISIVIILFASTLAPLTGRYGPIASAASGMLHVLISNQIGFLHAGVNLYNNGFAGGFVARLFITLSPVITKLKVLIEKSLYLKK